MSLQHAEKLMEAARLSFEGTEFELADVLCKSATRMARKSLTGMVKSPDLMKRLDRLTAASFELQADLATLRRAGFSATRAET